MAWSSFEATMRWWSRWNDGPSSHRDVERARRRVREAGSLLWGKIRQPFDSLRSLRVREAANVSLAQGEGGGERFARSGEAGQTAVVIFGASTGRGWKLKALTAG